MGKKQSQNGILVFLLQRFMFFIAGVQQYH